MERITSSEEVNFGDIPPEVDALLQQGVVAYRQDRACADRLFRQALAAAPATLPTYFCLYKIHTYQGNLDEAAAIARSGMREAAHQAGWPSDWREWRSPAAGPEAAGRFALYTLKALAFIHLRKGDVTAAREMLDRLRLLDPAATIGWSVIADLAEAM